eukprot:2696905-Prymnesium_polylepis.2
MTDPMHADRARFTLKVWPAWPRLAADRQTSRRLRVQMRMLIAIKASDRDVYTSQTVCLPKSKQCCPIPTAETHVTPPAGALRRRRLASAAAVVTTRPTRDLVGPDAGDTDRTLDLYVRTV